MQSCSFDIPHLLEVHPVLTLTHPVDLWAAGLVDLVHYGPVVSQQGCGIVRLVLRDDDRSPACEVNISPHNHLYVTDGDDAVYQRYMARPVWHKDVCCFDINY
uniref:Uncharacterized protein n=1 Tax=uncultured marine virus TaxID=186617 RepID=A0A0F7L4U6_9VIRU|nr:hypothetical protein [uncultured marine virus]